MKEKKSLMKKYFPTFSSEGFVTWFENLFSWANILALIGSGFSVWWYMIRSNFINLFYWTVWDEPLRWDYRGLYDLFEYVYTSSAAFVAFLIIAMFIIAQYVNYKNKRLTVWHFIIMCIIFGLIVLPFFWHWWVLDIIRELFWYDHHCSH